MVEAAQSGDRPDVAAELASALASLDDAIAQAGQSALVMRSSLAQVAALAEKVRSLESAIALARESLNVPTAGGGPAQPALRAVPAAQPPLAHDAPPEAPEDESQDAWEPAPAPQALEPVGEPSHCLRLGVASKSGSLDLKAVDGSVNENPAVVDVALLDYDGRRATLKLWINQAADPAGVRDALLGSLRRHLGDERDAEVNIEFEAVA
jgi:hypothetical protein